MSEFDFKVMLKHALLSNIAVNDVCAKKSAHTTQPNKPAIFTSSGIDSQMLAKKCKVFQT